MTDHEATAPSPFTTPVHADQASIPRVLLAALVSLTVHTAFSYGSFLLPPRPHRASVQPPAFNVEMIPEPEPAPAEPEPEVPPEPSPPPPIAPRNEPRPEPEPPEVEDPSPPEPSESNEPSESSEPSAETQIAGFLVSGEAGDGGLAAGRSGGALQKSRHRPQAKPKKAPEVPPSGPREVHFRDLSEKPRPPLLDGALLRNYPPGARLSGKAGQARVLLSVSSQGQVTRIRIVGASAPEFGDACRKTLAGTTWSVPRDQEGRAVGTLVPYECQFRVNP